MSANPHTGVLDPSVCRVSVRKVKLSFSLARRILIYLLEFDRQMQPSLFYSDVQNIKLTSKTQKVKSVPSNWSRCAYERL